MSAAVLLAFLGIAEKIAPYGEWPKDRSTGARMEFELTATWKAPVRRLAELSGLSRSTTQRELDSLEKRGLVLRVFREVGKSDEWGLGSVIRAYVNSNNGTVILNNRAYTVPELEYSWPTGLLSPAHERVYSQLGSEGQSKTAIAKLLGVKWDTAGKYLIDLFDCGLAAVDPAMGWMRGTATLEEAALKLDVAGKNARQKVQHAKEREAYEVWMHGTLPEDEGLALYPPQIHLIAGHYWDVLDGWLVSIESLWPIEEHAISREHTEAFFRHTATCPHCGGRYAGSEEPDVWRCEMCRAAVRLWPETGILALAYGGQIRNGFGFQPIFLGRQPERSNRILEVFDWKRYAVAQNALNDAWIAAVPHENERSTSDEQTELQVT